jgi:pantothenate kinase
MPGLMYDEILRSIADQIDNDDKNRYFIALCGPPASGKSTISEKLKSDLNTKGYKTSILQMDGFHYDDQILKEKKLLLKKGAPETFDVMGLISFVSRLYKEEEVAIPIFDRSLELSRSSAAIISKNNKVIIVEGNYILLNNYPWKELHKFFNTTVIINSEEKVLEKRLIERWEKFNLPKDEIKEKVYKNDLPNGVSVLKNSIKTDYILEN